MLSIIDSNMNGQKSLIVRFIAILISVVSLSVWAQPIQINEFLASNVRDFPEMYDFGDYNDWIELHNPGPQAVSLEGHFLSDDPDDPLKWSFPSNTIIPSNDYLLIWADDHDDAPGNIYTRETWPYADYTTRHYHTNFKLSKSGESIILSQAAITASVPLISSEAFWSYLDDGSDLDPAWTEVNYPDESWSEGQAELGYGDGDETTVVSYGNDGNDKYITTYFRKTFTVADATTFDDLLVRLKRDDGAVVYLNGNEILRSNLPNGEITFDTEANSAVSSDEEDAFYEYTVAANDLVSGLNCIAVEIHQISPTSSDISFDLELVGLQYSTATILDQVTYTQQLTDVSMGRPIDDVSWVYYGEPTPGSANNTPHSTITEKAQNIEVSMQSGFYETGITLALSTPSSTADIRYTLDGSRPGSSSQIYSTPISINSTTVLKARAIEVGLLPGGIQSESYFIGEEVTIPTISLVAEPPTLWDADIGIYENEYKQREIPVSIQYYDTEANLEFDIDAGARLGGLNIWTKAQKPFTIYTRDRFGYDLITSQIFMDKPITDFSRIVFRNGGDDWEETLLRDPMTGSLVKGMMDCGYMAFQPASLFLNGEYWGIHNIREKYNDRYFFENFGVDPDNIDHLEYGATQSGTRLLTIEGDQIEYDDFIAFVQSNDLDIPGNYSQLNQRMNIDGFIDHVVMTLYCANTSWGHNREWWRPRAGDGKWQWLIVDLDRGFNPANISTNLLDNLLEDYLLFQYLMDSQHFQERFLQRAAAHINNTFQASRIESIVDSLSNLIRDEMPRHIDRWGSQGGIASMTTWENELQAIKTFAQNRPGNIFSQFIGELSLDGTIELNTATYPSEGGYIHINKVPQLSENETGTYFKNQPIQLTAVPAPGWEVLGWSGISESTELFYDCERDTSFIALFQPSSGTILPSQITANTTLTENHTYYVEGNLSIPSGVTLEVEPGVVIYMPEQGHIVVEGQLLVNGTETSPASIRSNPLLGNSMWGGISFTNAVDTSRISHLILRGGSRGTDPIVHRGAISGENAHLVIDALDIDEVRFPIYIEGGSIQLRNSSLHCEFISDYINVKRAEALIDNCTFYGNEAPDTDAIDLDGVSEGVVSNNRIYNFAGANSDGIDIGEQSQGILMTGNLIYHSSDKGISVGQESTVFIERNLFVGCQRAVAVKDSSTAFLSNNTYVNNEYALACYEKNTGNGGGTAYETNSIFANSLISDLLVDALSAITVDYSISDSQLLHGSGNLFDDPLFLDGTLYNFQLASNSPCIDAGDPQAPFDEDGSPRDMGAYYLYSPDHYPFPIPGQLASYLKINEFLARNTTVNADESGEFDDWLEIYNPTEHDIDLSGHFLTDNPDNLDKWQIPVESAIIEPNGFLLFWCDEDGSQGPLHTNFKLSAGGEFLALVSPNGLSIIDSVSFGPQSQDISFGRVSDGDPTWDFLTPTPGSSNQSVTIESENVVPKQFSLHQNYPNPFNPLTTIRYEIPVRTRVQIQVFDIKGRLVKTLIDDHQSPGYKQVSWDGTNKHGLNVAGGLYLYSLSTDHFKKSRKLVLLH